MLQYLVHHPGEDGRSSTERCEAMERGWLEEGLRDGFEESESESTMTTTSGAVEASLSSKVEEKSMEDKLSSLVDILGTFIKIDLKTKRQKRRIKRYNKERKLTGVEGGGWKAACNGRETGRDAHRSMETVTGVWRWSPEYESLGGFERKFESMKEGLTIAFIGSGKERE